MPAEAAGLPPACPPSGTPPETAVSDFLASLRTPCRLLVAVSGGSDSLGLLAILHEHLRCDPSRPVSLVAATVDHGLRPEAMQEAAMVSSFCRARNIPHAICRWKGLKPSTGLMAAARKARYRLLAQQAAVFGADLIVTAHTADDQRETRMMRAARSAKAGAGAEAEAEAVTASGAGFRPHDPAYAGTGATGIARAVLFDRRVWIARPLLRATRSDIRAYLEQRHMVWIEDPSNEDTHYERVRIRQRLAQMPFAGSSNADEGARTALAQRAATLVRSFVHIHQRLVAEVDVDGLAVDPPAAALALAALTALIGGQSYLPALSRMQGVLEQAKSQGRPMTFNGVVFDPRGSRLFLARERRNLAPLTVPAGERVVWDGRWSLCNKGPGPVHAEFGVPPEALAFAAEVPARVRRLAAATALRLEGCENEGDVAVEPYFAAYDHFLTVYDVALASALAAAFGRGPYLPLPF